MKILVTRPRPEADATAARLRAAGHVPLVAPMQALAATGAPLSDGPWDGLVVTSPRAVAALENHPDRRRIAGLPAHAVGAKTAAVLEAAGFAVATVAAGNLQTLAETLAGTLPSGTRLLHLAGEEVVMPLAPILAPAGIALDVATVYAMAPATALPPDIEAGLLSGEIGAVLHFSARAAGILADLCAAPALAQAYGQLAHYCLSERIAEVVGVLVGNSARTPYVAATPDEAALLALVR